MDRQLLHSFSVLHSPYSSALQRREAEQYLIRWQRTEDAWSSALALLQPQAPVEAQVFAAQTLRHKTRHDVAGLAPRARQHVRHAILSRLSSGAPTRLLSPLSCALFHDLRASGLCLETLVGMTSGLPLEAALVLLQVVAEEAAAAGDSAAPAAAAATTHDPGPERSESCALSVRTVVRGWAGVVLAWLNQQLLQQASPECSGQLGAAAATAPLHAPLLSCLDAWLRLGALDGLDLEPLQQLLAAPFHVLAAPHPLPVVEAAADTACSVVWDIGDGRQQLLAPLVLPLADTAVAAAVAGAVEHADACIRWVLCNGWVRALACALFARFAAALGLHSSLECHCCRRPGSLNTLQKQQNRHRKCPLHLPTA